MTLSSDDRHRILTEIAPVLRDWHDAQCAYRGATGAQLAVGYRGELIVDHAWGLANAETGEAMRTDHLFRIASHSKTMTAVATFALIERGGLRLDDSAGMYVKELLGTTAGAVTVRELLGHQAGVIRDSSDGDFWQRGRDFPDAAELVDIVRREGVVFAPNEHFKYSNIGYGLLGLILERASGMSYADLVTETILRPLELADCGPELNLDRAAQYAAGHTGRRAYGDARRVIPHVDTRALAPATGWYSTASDLVRYGAAHVFGDERMLSDGSKRLMQRAESRIRVRDLPEATYGLGMDVQEFGGTGFVGHSGGYPGHITRTWIDPVDSLVISSLTNDIDGPAGALATGVLQLIQLAWAAAEEGATVPAELAFTGRFANLWGLVDVVDLGGTLHVISLRAPEPRTAATRLSVDSDALRVESVAGFGETGEPIQVERGKNGEITRVRIGAMTYWPIEAVDRAWNLPDPGELLTRMSLT